MIMLGWIKHCTFLHCNKSIRSTDRYCAVSDTTMSKTIRIGSRTSRLAVVQAEMVAASLKAQFPDYNFEIVTKTTLGDNVQNKALYSFGGKSLWTSELEELLVSSGSESIDMIVHCLKDVPTNLPDEFKIGAILEREGTITL
ncbi:porphobilinogen deaminase, dipyromethane cofactor binding domain-containing protein [Lipomyces starkeyi]